MMCSCTVVLGLPLEPVQHDVAAHRVKWYERQQTNTPHVKACEAGGLVPPLYMHSSLRGSHAAGALSEGSPHAVWEHRMKTLFKREVSQLFPACAPVLAMKAGHAGNMDQRLLCFCLSAAQIAQWSSSDKVTRTARCQPLLLLLCRLLCPLGLAVVLS